MNTKSICRRVRNLIFTVISLVLIFSAVLLTILNTYKPTYKVTIDGQFVGYFLDQQQFDDKFNVLVNEKTQIDESVKVYLNANPVFEKTYVKSSLLEEENLYTNLRAQLKTEYTVYAVSVNDEKKMIFNSKDDADKYSSELQKSATNVTSTVTEEKVEELEGLTSVETANAIVKDVVAKTKPEPEPEPVVTNTVKKATTYTTVSRNNTANSASAYGIWPTSSRRVSCVFGGYYGHTGMDIAGSYGDANRAYKDGKVIFAGWNSGGYGYLVKIDHGNGIQSWYAHNSRILVSAGQYVSQGQTIALQGSTGNSTGNHLHFEIRINGRAVNPAGYIQ